MQQFSFTETKRVRCINLHFFTYCHLDQELFPVQLTDTQDPPYIYIIFELFTVLIYLFWLYNSTNIHFDLQQIGCYCNLAYRPIGNIVVGLDEHLLTKVRFKNL